MATQFTRSRFRTAVIAGAALALTIPLAMVSPAQSATYSPLSQRGLANSSLGAADVPRWMARGVTPVANRTFLKGSDAPAPDICIAADGEDIDGKQPRKFMGSMVNTRESVDDFQFVEVNSDIYQYKSRAAAERAWAKLQMGVAQCAGRIEVDVEEEDASVRAVITTEVNQTERLFGTPGFTLFQDVDLGVNAADLEIIIIGDQYSSYYLAGTAVIRVEVANINGDFRGLGRVTRGFVDTMAIRIAQRVQQRSLR
jgi:hypothetical protein